jgi:glycosyltransferase involved in cell wall biosynthesis
MNKVPKLSIIIPCYNSENYIGKTIESVLNQTFQDWEIIIINDGSTDNSVKKITEFLQIDSRISLFSIKNGGVNSARNFGFSKISATSEYLHFLDSDDIIESNFLIDLIEFLDNNRDFGAVYCNHYFIDEADKIIDSPDWGKRYLPTIFWFKEELDSKIETSQLSIALWCKIVEPMVIMRRNVFELTRKWNTLFKHGLIGEGVVLFTEMASKTKIGYLNKELFGYRRHSAQSSQQNNQINSTNLAYKILFENGILDKKYRFIINRYLAFSESKKLKHLLRHHQFEFIKTILWIFVCYLKSIPSIFYRHK